MDEIIVIRRLIPYTSWSKGRVGIEILASPLLLPVIGLLSITKVSVDGGSREKPFWLGEGGGGGKQIKPPENVN